MAPRRSRRTVAFLVRGLEPGETYSRKAWRALYDLAEEHSSNLLMVAGRVLDDPNPFDRAHAAVFRLLNRGFVDAALLSTTVTSYTAPSRLGELDLTLGELPVVTMSVQLGNRPQISVDNSAGLAELMRHLIEVHGYRRIVHVRGPYPNEDAARREAVWRSELERAGIEVRPEWLVPGDFEMRSLRTIGSDILERVGTDFDAVVAGNDIAAHRVLEDFKALGYRVPEDFAVVGFDDLEKSQHSHPPLTTVRQPFDELAVLAWEQMDKLLARRRPHSFSVPSTLVVRASCGCAYDGGAAPQTESELLGVINGYERGMESFQANVYNLHNFIRAMNRVTDAEQLAPILSDWLPRLGVGRFAVLCTCTETGEAQEHVCQWEGEMLPTAPAHFSVLISSPAFESGVISTERFTLAGWFSQLPAFVLGLFPLVTNDTWFGLAVLELSRSAGLLELTLQEQLASTLDRITREKKFRKTETVRRYAAEVAREIDTPLDVLMTAHREVRSAVSQLAREWMPFVLGLSDQGRDLFVRLYEGMPRIREQVPAPALVSRWVEVLVAAGAAQPARLARDLLRLGSIGTEDELAVVAKNPDLARVVGFLTELADLPPATAAVGDEAEIIARYVDQLRRSLL